MTARRCTRCIGCVRREQPLLLTGPLRVILRAVQSNDAVAQQLSHARSIGRDHLSPPGEVLRVRSHKRLWLDLLASAAESYAMILGAPISPRVPGRHASVDIDERAPVARPAVPTGRRSLGPRRRSLTP